MLTVKEWLQNRTDGAQFEPIMQTEDVGIIKAKRLNDGEIFEIGKNLGISGFIYQEKRMLQRINICFFWDDKIHVSLEIDIFKPSEYISSPEGDTKLVSLDSDIVIIEINELTTKKLAEICKEMEANFIKRQESQDL
jgi:hypothetical protein